MIPYGKQNIIDSDLTAVSRVLSSDWLTMGPEGEIFEDKIKAITGANHAIAVSSGTAALHVAYEISGLEPGSEVITSPLTFVATAATAMKAGLKVVFADVERSTGNLDPKEVEKLITENTKVITVVDYAGHPGEMDEFRQLANKHNLLLISDAAHSFASNYKNQAVGSLADITCFSFFPTKNFTTGEGGALVCNSELIANQARAYRSQGMVRDKNLMLNKDEGPWHQEVHQIGLNYRLPDILAALGTSQLERILEFKNTRKKIFNFYTQALGDISEIQLPAMHDYVDPMWHLFPIRVSAEIRKELFLFLREAGIGVQVNYLPVYWHPYFVERGYTRGLCPIAEEFYQQEISLPMHVNLNEKELEKIVKTIKLFFQNQ